jgi:hypothetical protein
MLLLKLGQVLKDFTGTGRRKKGKKGKREKEKKWKIIGTHKFREFSSKAFLQLLSDYFSGP